jgi:hypothetical protein
MFEGIAFIIAITAGISFFYKVYIHGKIKATNKVNQPSLLWPRVANIAFFLPIGKRNKSAEEMSLAKKANIALLIFYSCFVAIGLLTAIYFSIHPMPRKVK